MGLPQIAISFKDKGVTAIRRSQKGVALLLFERAGEDFSAEYKSFAEIDKADHDENELIALERCFNEGVKKVICLSLNDIDAEKTENALKNHSFNWLGLCTDKVSGADLKRIVNDLRNHGSYVKAVVPYQYDFNDSAFVVLSEASVKFALDENTYTQASLVPILTGMLAYMPLGESITYRRMNEIVEYSCKNDADGEIDRGRIVLTRDSEGYKIGRGVNNLTDGAEDMKKIRVTESMDAILTDIKTSLEEGYIGKVRNDYDSKLLLCIAISGYFEGLGESVIDKSYANSVGISLEGQKQYLRERGIDVDEMSEMEILRANTGSYVFLSGNIRFVDAMEDVAFSIEM